MLVLSVSTVNDTLFLNLLSILAHSERPIECLLMRKLLFLCLDLLISNHHLSDMERRLLKTTLVRWTNYDIAMGCPICVMKSLVFFKRFVSRLKMSHSSVISRLKSNWVTLGRLVLHRLKQNCFICESLREIRIFYFIYCEKLRKREIT